MTRISSETYNMLRAELAGLEYRQKEYEEGLLTLAREIAKLRKKVDAELTPADNIGKHP